MLIALLVVHIASSSQAAPRVVYLGTLGPTHPIVESDMLEVIEERLKSLRQTGVLGRLQRQFVKRARRYADSPPGLSLPRATEHSITKIDVAFRLNRDIVDAEGNVLFAAGTLVDPLEGRTVTRVLCFVDGTDAEQVEWLASACTDETRCKLILVRGSLSEVARTIPRRLHFDQGGYLVTALGITALPTVVRQIGEGLYAEQIPIE
jgi:conjugal transfer pilus assembly protein TraW